MPLNVSDPAHEDLEGIWTVIYNATGNETTANRQVRELTRRFPLIEASPTLGRVRPEIAPDMRSLATGNYVIYYRVTNDQIEVARVVHGARAVENVFDLPT